MDDNAMIRQRRSRAHRRGDHSLCQPDCTQPKRKTSPVTLMPAAPESVEPSVLAAVRSALEDVGRTDTYLAVAALTLAAKIDDSKGSQGVPQLVKELRTTMEGALAGSTKAGKLLDIRNGRLRGASSVDGTAS